MSPIPQAITKTGQYGLPVVQRHSLLLWSILRLDQSVSTCVDRFSLKEPPPDTQPGENLKIAFGSPLQQIYPPDDL